MKTLYDGKTKTVMLDEETNVTHLFFKDTATGENGMFDPGYNTVGGSVEGKGNIGLRVSKYFFELMEANGIPTHYLGADLDKNLMKVRTLTVPKLEFVLRYFTAGSMSRRFDLEEGIVFDPPYTEVTLKSDEQGDPLISERLHIVRHQFVDIHTAFPSGGIIPQGTQIVGRIYEIIDSRHLIGPVVLNGFSAYLQTIDGFVLDGELHARAHRLSPVCFISLVQ